MSELERKAESAGGSSSSINVRQLKTSQYDHSTGAFVKKRLSERWHVFADGRGQVQRDVYSAFLALHVVQTVDADGVVTQAHDRALLEQCWVELEPALRAKGLFKQTEAAGMSETLSPEKGVSEGVCIPRRSGSCPGYSSKAQAVRPKPGRRARGAVHSEKNQFAIGLNPKRNPSGVSARTPRR
jgi:hypothetical protein